MSLVELYLVLVVLPGINDWLEVIAAVLLLGGGVAMVIFGAFTMAEELFSDEEWMGGVKKYGGRYLAITGLVCLLGVVAPDEEQLQKIIGGYVITNVEGIEQLPENLVEYANKFLEGESEGGEG